MADSTTTDVTVHLTPGEYEEAVGKAFDRGVKVTVVLLHKVLDELDGQLSRANADDSDIEGAAI